jgi:hypothetical protein
MHEEAPMALSDTGRLEHAGLASVVMLLAGAAFAFVSDESRPVPDSYGTDNSVLWWFLALLAFGVVAMVAATSLRKSFAVRSADGRQRWSRAAAVAVIVVALLAPLVLPAPLVLAAPQVMLAPLVLLVSLALRTSLVRLAPVVLCGAADVMFALSLSKPSFDSCGLVLRVVPAVLVSRAAVRCARAGFREVHGRTTGCAPALSATVLAYSSATVLAYSSTASWPPRPSSLAPP